MDREKARVGGLSLSEELLQRTVDEHSRELMLEANQLFGTPTESLMEQSGLVATNKLIRVDGSVARDLYLPKANGSVIGRAVAVLNEGEGTSIITIHAQPEDSINGSQTYAMGGSSWNIAALVCFAPGKWTVLQGSQSLVGWRVWNVGLADWMYPTIQAAVDAINADPDTAPSSTNRGIIRIWPGYYTMTSLITIPQWVCVQGFSKGQVQLYNATTDMFRPSGNNWFEDLLIEGSSTTSIAAFDGNNASDVHIRRVDMLKNGGNNKQLFIKQSGATWATWFVEDCIIDWYSTGGAGSRLCSFDNTAAAARMVDVTINNVFFDAYQLTDYATMIACRGCTDLRVKNSTIRGQATYHTGVRVEVFGVTGTPEAHVRHCFLEGGVPVYGEASTNYYLINTDAIGSTTAGSRTMRNSSV